MKKLLVFIILVLSSTFALRAQGRTAYYDYDKVVSSYDFANDLMYNYEKKQNEVLSVISKRENTLIQNRNIFDEKIRKGLLTTANAEQQRQMLQRQEADFQNYSANQKRYLEEEKQVIMRRINDRIRTYLTKYNETHNYSMITAVNNDGNPMAFGPGSVDITEDLIQGLNYEYLSQKASGTAY